MYVRVEDPKPYYTAHACRVGHNKDLTISSASAESVVTETPDKVTVCLVHAVAITIHSGLDSDADTHSQLAFAIGELQESSILFLSPNSFSSRFLREGTRK